jgi:hypothetical protein
MSVKQHRRAKIAGSRLQPNRFLTEVVQNSHQNKVVLRKNATFILLAMLLVLPVVLSNVPSGAALGILCFVLLFFFPGYLLLSLVGKFPNGLHWILSVIFGIAAITTAFDLLARASMSRFFFYFVAALSAAGLIAMVLPQPQIWARSFAFRG